MKFFKKLDITIKLLILIVLPLIIVYLIAAFIVYSEQRKKIQTDVEITMSSEVKNLTYLLISEYKSEKQQLKNNLKIFMYLLEKEGEIKETQDKIEVEIINTETKRYYYTEVNRWVQNGKQIYNNFDLVDKFRSLTGFYATIYQKTDEGFLCLSSNMPNKSGNRAMDLLVPRYSDIAYSIESGQMVIKKDIFYGKWYTSIYKPMYVNGDLKGMIQISREDAITNKVQQIFTTKIYYNSGYAFIADKYGDLLIHPTLAGKSIKHSYLFRQMKKIQNQQKIEKIDYKWPENTTGQDKELFVYYLKDQGLFVGVALFKKDIYESLNVTKKSLLYAILLSTIVLTIVIIYVSYLIRNEFKKINNLLKIIEHGAEKDLSKHINLDNCKEINDISSSLLDITKRNNQIFDYLKMIEDKKFDNIEDIIPGRDEIKQIIVSLLRKTKEAEQIKFEKERQEKIDNWINQGLAKFVDILRLNNDQKDILYFDILSNLIRYLDAIQGGLFVIRYENEQPKSIEMVAAFAYGRKRILEKQIPADSGLLGRVVLEKKSIHLEEIPDNYVSISSGIGDAKPTELLIVPLMFNEKIYGIIEVTSLKKFEEYHIKFVEKIGESIASTISNIQVNERTEQLLKQSQEQSAKLEKQEKQLRRNIEELEKLRIKTEEREKEMQGLIKAVNSTAMVVELDPEGNITNINEKFLDLLHKDKKELIGKHHSKITSIDVYSDEYIEFWNDLISGKSRHIIEPIHINDKTYWISETFTPLTDINNKVYKIINIAMDITENKMLERQLRLQVKEMRSQEKQLTRKQKELEKTQKELELKSKSIDNLYQAIDNSFLRFELAKDGAIMQVNKNVVNVFGFDEESLIKLNIKDIYAAVDRQRFLGHISEAINGNPITDFVRFVDKEGNNIRLIITYIPIVDFDGKISRITLLAIEEKH